MEIDVINIPNGDGTDPLPESSRFKSLPVNNKQIEKHGLKKASWHTDRKTSSIATAAVYNATAGASILNNHENRDSVDTLILSGDDDEQPTTSQRAVVKKKLGFSGQNSRKCA